eukprot:2316560-Rhodomonas_salina.4
MRAVAASRIEALETRLVMMMMMMMMIKNQGSRSKNQESRIKNQESRIKKVSFKSRLATAECRATTSDSVSSAKRVGLNESSSQGCRLTTSSREDLNQAHTQSSPRTAERLPVLPELSHVALDICAIQATKGFVYFRTVDSGVSLC